MLLYDLLPGNVTSQTSFVTQKHLINAIPVT